MKNKNPEFEELKNLIAKEKKISQELESLENYLKGAEIEERRMISSQISLLKKVIKRTNEEIPGALNKINFKETSKFERKDEKKEISKTQEKTSEKTPEKTPSKMNTGFSVSPIMWAKKYTIKDLKPTSLEKQTLKRIRKKQNKKEEPKEKKPNKYISIANQIFSTLSDKIINKKTFEDLERDLIKANMQFTSRSYISVIFLSTLISIFIGIAFAVFFLFFNLEATLPFITRVEEALGLRLLKVIWIPFLAPFATFMIMYIYPGLEKSSAEDRINGELPFATIHMSAISGAMIDPSKIFDIIILTKEYPSLEKEFRKLLNEINVYGYDLVSALRNSARNSPSKKLSELFNGLATTINSGGYLPEFFEKRAQTLLFEHNLEKEKKTKAAETFMDIYISIVIAAPMILMVLLMMMKISGLGISLSTSMITLIMVLSVTMINIVFLTFLQLKK
ncbi:MAG: type II secretion system F family protein [Candidatus Diapherotrites archaeon]